MNVGIKVFFICILFLAQTALARNIFTEQTEATEARDAHLRMQTTHQELQTAIAQKKALIAREQSALIKLESEEKKAKLDLEKSYSNLDTKLKALERAWEQRDLNR